MNHTRVISLHTQAQNKCGESELVSDKEYLGYHSAGDLNT